MGIQGVESFVEKDLPSGEACQEVYIKDIVEKFRRETGTEEEPIIAFHGSRLVKYIFREMDWVCGGQSREALERIRTFIDAFRKVGVKPVFFFRGFSEAFEKDRWVDNSRRNLKQVYELYDAIANGGRLKVDTHKNFPPVETFSQYFSEIYGCEVFKAGDQCNVAIARYARQNKNCIAIFGQDSEFLIHEGAKYYLSAQHFDQKNMKTRNYSREGLARKLDLHPSQLPLFGALATHNRHSLFFDLQAFHRKLCKGNNTSVEKRFPAIAQYVKKMCHRQQPPFYDYLLQILPEVAMDAMGDRNAADCLEISIRLFSPTDTPPSLKSDNPTWDLILSKAEELHRANRNPEIFRKVLNGYPIESAPVLEDYRRKDLPSSMCMLKPMRQRLYGILLMERPPNPEETFVTEWWSESLIVSKQVEPTPPDDEHPGLIKLWGDDRSEEMQNIRWKLFAHAVSPRLNPFELKKLPDNLILPTASLFYLWERFQESTKKRLFEVWEMDALIAMVVLVAEGEPLGKPIHRIDPQAVHIASLYNRTRKTVRDILAVCGYPLTFEKTFVHPYFDGKLFQKKYCEARSGGSPSNLCQKKESLLAEFQIISKIVFNEA